MGREFVSFAPVLNTANYRRNSLRAIALGESTLLNSAMRSQCLIKDTVITTNFQVLLITQLKFGIKNAQAFLPELLLLLMNLLDYTDLLKQLNL